MFYITEQGARIQTPLESLVKGRGVNALEAIPAIAKIGSDQAISDTNTATKTKISSAYQESNNHESKPREPAIFAEQIMTHPVKAIRLDESAHVISALFNQQRFHHLPVIDKNATLCGIVSDRDIMRISLNEQFKRLKDIPVANIMTKRVISAGLKTEIRSIAEVMCQQQFSAMPITDEHQKLLGIVSRSDILRTIVNQSPLELWV